MLRRLFRRIGLIMLIVSAVALAWLFITRQTGEGLPSIAIFLVFIFLLGMALFGRSGRVGENEEKQSGITPPSRHAKHKSWITGDKRK